MKVKLLRRLRKRARKAFSIKKRMHVMSATGRTFTTYDVTKRCYWFLEETIGSFDTVTEAISTFRHAERVSMIAYVCKLRNSREKSLI